MKILSILGVFFAVVGAASAQSPQAVAEIGLRTIYDRNAESFERVAHPLLKSKIRSCQLLAIVASSKKPAPDLRTASDLEVAKLFCEALDMALPLDQRFDYACEYDRSEERGDYMVLTFKTGPRSKATHKADLRREVVVLKKQEGRWLFLWSVPMAFNVDPTWDARKEVPNQSSEPTRSARGSS